jgi:hypothetical protein
MAEEMRLHLELQAECLRANGMSASDARYAALRQFGGVERIKETARIAPNLPPQLDAGRSKAKHETLLINSPANAADIILHERQVAGRFLPGVRIAQVPRPRRGEAWDRCPPPSASFRVWFSFSHCPGDVFALKPLLQFDVPRAQVLGQRSSYQFGLRLEPSLTDHARDFVSEPVG